MDVKISFRETRNRHVPIPKLIQNFWVLGFVVLGTALGFGIWVSFGFGVLGQFWV
jgi:hypothetical protein